MRHWFNFPESVRRKVREHVARALQAVEPVRFNQEPAYVAALLARLQGKVCEGPDGTVVIETTNVDALGPGAAESWSGADLAITASVSSGGTCVRKAILAQAKLGALDDLDQHERARLNSQIDLMRQHTARPKVLMIERRGEHRTPRMHSGTAILKGQPTAGYDLPRYFTSRILTTLDGDTRPTFVSDVQRSDLRQLRVMARQGG